MPKISVLFTIQIFFFFNIPVLTAETFYSVTSLGNGTPYSINDLGQIVGVSNGYATLFDPNNGINNITLGTLSQGGLSEAHDINNYGKIVGYSYNSIGVQKATLFDITGQGNNMELGRNQGSDKYSRAYSINNVNIIVGGVYNGNAAIFDIGGATYSALGNGEAYAIQNDGQIVGYSRSATPTPSYACIFTGGQRINLGYLPGNNSLSRALANNQGGQIVGYSSNSTGRLRAVLFDSTGNQQNVDLQTLGGIASAANAINDGGLIVGYAYNAAGIQRATLFDSTGGGSNIDLNTVIDQTSGWVLNNALGINNNGWIVGTGSKGAFLLRPLGDCTQRPQMDFNGDCKVDIQDFAIFCQSWLECNLNPPISCWE